MLQIIRMATRAVLRRWPMLLAWYLAGMAGRFGVIQLAALVGAHSTLAAMLIMPVAALCRLVGFVGMFFVVRAELAEQLGARDDFLTVLTRSILPFFLFYAAWHYLGEDVRLYSAQALQNINWFAPGETGANKVLDVSLSPLSITFVVVAFAVRFVIGKLESRLPKWTRIPATYAEAVWVFGSLMILSQLLDKLKDWAETRRGLYWFFEVKQSLAEGVLSPLGWLSDAIGWVINEGTALLVLPLAWLTITGTIYNRSLEAGELRWRPRIVSELKVVKTVRRRVLLPKAISSRLSELWHQLIGQWEPMVDALKIIWRAGVVPLGFFVLVWTIFSVASDALTWVATRLIGPHPLYTWWSGWLPVLDFAVEAFLMPLQITLVAAAYAFAVTRVGDQVADEQPAAPVTTELPPTPVGERPDPENGPGSPAPASS